MQSGWRYGWMGMPLAMAGLPLVMHLPQHLALQNSLSLATVGVVFMACRLFDALIDPWFGQLTQTWLRNPRPGQRWAAGAALALLTGMALLWWLPRSWAYVWLVLGLLLTYSGLSLLTLWQLGLGMTQGGSERDRSAITAWREGMALPGVVLASVSMTSAPSHLVLLILVATLVPGWWFLSRMAIDTVRVQNSDADAKNPALHPSPRPSMRFDDLALPFQALPFRWLWCTYLLSATGSAIAATVMPFFVTDYLQRSAELPLFLLAYFAALACSLPLWLRCVERWGLARNWSFGLMISMLVFAGTFMLQPGAPFSSWWFGLICVLTGAAAGAELACPAALLLGWLQMRRQRPTSQARRDLRNDSASPQSAEEGIVFGWWTLGSKLSLALAAFLALGALGVLGHVPGRGDGAVQVSVLWVYAVGPWLFKAAAWLAWRRGSRLFDSSSSLTPLSLKA